MEVVTRTTIISHRHCQQDNAVPDISIQSRITQCSLSRNLLHVRERLSGEGLLVIRRVIGINR
jgi:hypothetical protein